MRVEKHEGDAKHCALYVVQVHCELVSGHAGRGIRRLDQLKA